MFKVGDKIKVHSQDDRLGQVKVVYGKELVDIFSHQFNKYIKVSKFGRINVTFDDDATNADFYPSQLEKV
ncbi:hypothetical protein [Sediminitomix flava]|uniref:Uncharacterized protein n=1 Tax=Sediminitomix flava TaxID=379075 RepID=A0A315ZCF8_SEDFL|nr:hypothetical protein [Sediminitomix flava]PWJ42508.1 hypothetical protein BC781_10249 [Sediminitomix flava]